ncbi:MAG: pyocin knob domain-containing protein [Paracoccaceae bacterium]
MAKPTKPTVPPAALRSDPATFAARAEVNISFFPTLVDYLDASSDFVDQQANAALAAAQSGDLPPIAGQAGNLLQVNPGGTALTFWDPDAYGIGGVGAACPGDDLNNVVHSGKNQFAVATLNKPGPSNSAGTIEHIEWNSASATQIAVLFFPTEDVGDLYVRTRRGGTWDPWIKQIGVKHKASQVQAEAGLDNDTWMSPLRTAQEIAKLSEILGRVNFDGTGTVAIRGSKNVSSITDLGVGQYRVNWTTAAANADYVPVASAGSAVGDRAAAHVRNVLTTSFEIYVINHGNAAYFDPTWVTAIAVK